MDLADLESRLLTRLEFLYGAERAPELLLEIKRLMERHRQARAGERLELPRWSERDAMLITYGDSIHAPGTEPLRALKDFLDRRLRGVLPLVHILPFFPFSSDDGFAVSDFRSVDPALGEWEDIAALGEHFTLLFDLVLNHMSREHLWFVDYVHDSEPGRHFVIEVDPNENLSMVVRPRSTPLLSRVRTHDGFKHVWATFSNDQIDLNYANPIVLLEFIDILLDYVRRGARGIRLDAVGFLWKKIGTSCIHLPETHEVVKLFRDLFDYLEPGAILLTETNVPHAENISYFGDGDEAHMVYQFSLPPLVLHAIDTGSTRYLQGWAQDLEQTSLPPGCTYLNFTASHDGVGLRPLEGIVPDAEVDQLIEHMHQRGAFVSMRATSEGMDRPYELNISYFDAFRSPDPEDNNWHIPRFLLSQTLPLVLQGIPAIYINAITATPNDQLGVERTGMTRSINRRKWDLGELERRLDDPNTEAGRVFPEYVRRLRLRQTLPALHPEAPQHVPELPDGLFGVVRHSQNGQYRLVALHNCTRLPQEVPLDDPMLAEIDENWMEVCSNSPVEITDGHIQLTPYQVMWLVPVDPAR